jgi:hypothetical protein
MVAIDKMTTDTGEWKRRRAAPTLNYKRGRNKKMIIIMIPSLLITVGAGTSGCVLAARLSENPSTKVLLVEAGDQMGYFTKIPLTPTAAQQGPNDWSVRTKAQKYSSFGLWGQVRF